MRKAQLTIFMIIAVVVVLMLIFIVVFVRNVKEATVGQAFGEVMGTAKDMTSVKDYIGSCLGNSARQVMAAAGLQGGLVLGENYQGPHITRGEYIIPYFLYQKNIYLPDVSVRQEMLANATAAAFLDCIDPAAFQEISLSLSKPDVVTLEVLIGDSSVIYNLNTSIQVKRRMFTSKLESFNHVAPVKLGLVLRRAADIVAQIKAANTNPQSPSAFDISTLNFSADGLRACYQQDGSDRFIRIEQFSPGKVFDFLFAVDGDVAGTCTKFG